MKDLRQFSIPPPPHSGKGLIFIDTDTGFKTLATTKYVFFRAEKNKFQTRTESEVPKVWKTLMGSELDSLAPVSVFSWC